MQTCALTKIAASTWGASFLRARQVYSAMIRPAITYGSTVWHAPSNTKDAGKNTTEKLAIIQNRCLRVVAGAYKATPIEVLRAETMMPPMQEYLDLLQAKARSRLKDGGQTAFIKKQSKQVAAKLRKRGTATTPNTPGSRKHEWASDITKEITNTLPLAQPAPWAQETEEYPEQLQRYKASRRQKENIIKKHFADKWQAKWQTFQKAHEHDPTAAQAASLSKKERPDIHADLVKAENALAVQIRTEKIGFAQFLHRRRVPTVTSPAYDYGWHSQTAKHVIRHCSLRPNR